MLKDFAAKLATLALTVAVSGTMVVAAVGPATAGGQHAVASAPRFMA
jgi:hypothetical protein